MGKKRKILRVVERPQPKLAQPGVSGRWHLYHSSLTTSRMALGCRATRCFATTLFLSCKRYTTEGSSTHTSAASRTPLTHNTLSRQPPTSTRYIESRPRFPPAGRDMISLQVAYPQVNHICVNRSSRAACVLSIDFNSAVACES